MASSSSRARLGATMLLFAGLLLLIFWLLRDGRGADPQRAGRSEPAGEQRPATGSGRSGFVTAPGEIEPEGTLPLDGRVQWSDGRPAEGATVRILSRPSAGRTSVAPDRETVSDGQGSFSFDRQMAGEFVVQAQKEDSISPAVRLQLAAGSKPVTLVLFAGASLTITVASATDSRPIAGALVRVQLANDQVLQGDAFREARTNPLGQARFAGLDPVANHAVWAEAEGYAGKQVNVLPMEHASLKWTERIVLVPGSGVSGRVLDARGNPVAGALVGWCNTEETLDESSFRVFMPFSDYGRMSEQITDAGGRYHLTVETGSGCVVAEKPQLRVGTKCKVPVRRGQETRNVDLVLLEGMTVRGQVVDPAGRPAAGAEVLATTPDASHNPSMRRAYRYRTQSDGEGRFVLAGLPPIAIALAATSAQASSPLAEVDPRKGAEVTLKLEYEGTLDGQVTEIDGRPVPFAAINYWIEPDYRALEAENGGKPPTVFKQFALPTSNEATVSDADGRFHVGGLAPAKYALRAGRPTATEVPPSYGGVTQYQVPTGSNVRLIMPGVGAIRGRVRSDDGAPIRSFDVSLLVATPSANAPDYLFPQGHHFSNPDGSFLFPGVPANRYTLRVDGDEVIAQRVNVEVKGSETADAGTINVAKGQPARSGLVVDARREPISRATVTIEVPDPPARLQTVSESDGSFRVPSVRSGISIRLRADWAGGGASEWTPLGPGDSSVTLMVVTKGNGAVRGVLIGSGELVGRTVILSHAGDKPPGTGDTEVRSVAETTAGGVFTFENVPPGSYALWTPLGTNFARHPEMVEVQQGRDSNVIFDVAGSAQVSR